MAYSPVNSQVFMSAYAGAIAGIAGNGWNISAVLANYDDICDAAGAFAQAVDIAWASATALTVLEVEALQTVAQAVFGKFPVAPLAPASDATAVYLKTAAAWATAAGAVEAIVKQSTAYMTAEGITSPTAITDRPTILSGSVSLATEVAADAILAFPITVTGALITDFAVVNVEPALPVGLLISCIDVSADSVVVTLQNVTAGPLTATGVTARTQITRFA